MNQSNIEILNKLDALMGLKFNRRNKRAAASLLRRAHKRGLMKVVDSRWPRVQTLVKADETPT